MVRDPEFEKIAVETVVMHEESRGWKVQSAEEENRGFDLISRRPHPEDPDTAIEVRFIEVKGRSHIGEAALTTNEYPAWPHFRVSQLAGTDEKRWVDGVLAGKKGLGL